ncbi:HepT-like ribonuclease domain-containing protein [Desulfomarina profundi]|nr:HepT-like ribonuclease domain-containing protein [Desulfomarina profundi]
MRDIISHHYFDIDAEEIYWVCENKIPELIETLQKIIADISEER